MESDLDTAEDKAADQTEKVKDLETQNEELIRENKQLQRKVDVLEGKTSLSCSLCQLSVQNLWGGEPSQ